jgi:aerobic-type carbon monoxide dehydrogenase small subunit (CoxS/CutS family)
MATKKQVRVKVNGRDHEAEVEPRVLLVHFIRDILALTEVLHRICRAGGWSRDSHDRRRRQ